MRDTSKHKQYEHKPKLIEGIDFYFDKGLMVFTEVFHLKRGECCGSKCKHCPFDYINVPKP